MEDTVSEISNHEDTCSVHSHGKDETPHNGNAKDHKNTSRHQEEEFPDLDIDLSEAEIRERKLMYLVDIEDFAEEGVNIFLLFIVRTILIRIRLRRFLVVLP